MKQMIFQIIGWILPAVRDGGTFLPAKYSVYRAKITQATTAAPAEGNVDENTYSAALVWARSAAGVYTITLAGAFVVAKTLVKIQSGAATGAANQRVFSVVITSTDVITINVGDVATPTAADSGNFDIEILTPLF
jgi:hypothetical protein